MAETQTVHMMLFPEDRQDEAAEALSRLRESGYSHDDISVISGVPLSDRVLGRPLAWTRIGQFGIVGAILGFIIAAILTFGTPALYGLRVGGQPLFAIPTSIVVLFELTMLGLLIDGKMWRFLVVRYTDWAANDVFFFGAMAIALISGYALKANKHP